MDAQLRLQLQQQPVGQQPVYHRLHGPTFLPPQVPFSQQQQPILPPPMQVNSGGVAVPYSPIPPAIPQQTSLPKANTTQCPPKVNTIPPADLPTRTLSETLTTLVGAARSTYISDRVEQLEQLTKTMMELSDRANILYDEITTCSTTLKEQFEQKDGVPYNGLFKSMFVGLMDTVENGLLDNPYLNLKVKGQGSDSKRIDSGPPIASASAATSGVKSDTVQIRTIPNPLITPTPANPLTIPAPTNLLTIPTPTRVEMAPVCSTPGRRIVEDAPLKKRRIDSHTAVTSKLADGATANLADLNVGIIIRHKDGGRFIAVEQDVMRVEGENLRVGQTSLLLKWYRNNISKDSGHDRWCFYNR